MLADSRQRGGTSNPEWRMNRLGWDDFTPAELESTEAELVMSIRGAYSMGYISKEDYEMHRIIFETLKYDCPAAVPASIILAIEYVLKAQWATHSRADMDEFQGMLVQESVLLKMVWLRDVTHNDVVKLVTGLAAKSPMETASFNLDSPLDPLLINAITAKARRLLGPWVKVADHRHGGYFFFSHLVEHRKWLWHKKTAERLREPEAWAERAHEPRRRPLEARLAAPPREIGTGAVQDGGHQRRHWESQAVPLGDPELLEGLGLAWTDSPTRRLTNGPMDRWTDGMDARDGWMATRTAVVQHPRC